MSFILDALRKSEAARRRNDAPDLFTAMPHAPEPIRAQRPWALWLLAAIGAIALIAIAWRYAARPDTNETTAHNPAAIASADPAAMDPSTAPTEPPSSHRDLAPPASPTSPAQSAPQAAAESAPPPAPPPQQTAVVAPRIETPTAPARPIATTSTATTPSAPPTMPLPSKNGEVTAALSDMDPELRRQLPPLKLSMHLWNETPSRRFIILDGQRLKEGDVHGDVVVERIDREGAVLVWRGVRVKLD